MARFRLLIGEHWVNGRRYRPGQLVVSDEDLATIEVNGQKKFRREGGDAAPVEEGEAAAGRRRTIVRPSSVRRPEFMPQRTKTEAADIAPEAPNVAEDAAPAAKKRGAGTKKRR